jgi:hypothetical protein
MRVTGETPAPATGRRVGELKAQGQDKSEDELDKRLAIVKQAKVRGVIVEIDRDGAVVPRPHSGLGHGSPPGHQVTSVDEIRWGYHTEIARRS